jgi:hypothetical protein
MKTGLAASLLLPALLATFSNTLAVEVQPTQPKQVRVSDAALVLLKLQRGEVSEQVIVTYIENAKRNFDFSADEIVYLKQNGVSDKIITAALNHRAKFPQVILAPPSQQTAVTPRQPQQTIVVTQPQTTYVQAAPAPVYVYSPPAYSYYYNPVPYYSYNYYPYRTYGYRYPSFSVNFGFRHGYYGGYHRWSGYNHHVGYGRSWAGHHHWR